VARGINDVDPMLFVILIHAAPEAGRGRRSDRDATLLFLLHPIHYGISVMDFADFVGDSGIEKNSLGSCRFPGIDMRHDADVAIAV
jgi:hypothetical protein